MKLEKLPKGMDAEAFANKAIAGIEAGKRFAIAPPSGVTADLIRA